MLSYGIEKPMGGSRYGDGGHKWSAIVLPCEECMEVSAQWNAKFVAFSVTNVVIKLIGVVIECATS